MTKLQDSPTAGARELRQHPRRKLEEMAYVELTQDNGGTLLNLSEGGFAIQSALVLSSLEFPELRFQLPNMRGWLTGSGRVVWISESKKEAGIQFLDLHEHARAQVRTWVSKERLDEPAAAELDLGGYEAAVSGPESQSEPKNGRQTPWGTSRGSEGASTQGSPQNFGPARHTEAPPAQDDRSFRFNDYSMFAADANGDITWIEPAKPRRGWGSYILFTILLATLFFVLGATMGRDNLIGWVSSVQGWKTIQDWKPLQGEAPPSPKPPAPPEESDSTAPSDADASSAEAQSTASDQPKPDQAQSGSGENAAPTPSVTPEQKTPEGMGEEHSAAKAQPSGDESAAVGSVAAVAPPAKAEGAPPKAAGATGSQDISTARAHRTNTAKAGASPHRDTAYATPEVMESSEYGRSMLVNAPAAGSPPVFVNLPAEPISASSSVAISARRSIQVPPRADGYGYGSERMVVGKLLAHSDPFYPAEARSKRIEGIVELQALVGRTGQVISVTPISGPEALVAAGATALHEWRYAPTFINGDPVETHVHVTMVFRSP